MALASLAGCATAGQTRLSRAQNASDSMREMLVLVDEEAAKIFSIAAAKADREHPDDDAAYDRVMESFENVNRVIEAARLEHALLSVAVGQWEQDPSGRERWYDVLPCALVTVETLAAVLTEPLRGAALAVARQLRALRPAHWQECRRQP